MQFKAHIPLSTEPSDREKSYGLAWVRTVLPASTGTLVGLNPTSVSEMPNHLVKGLEKPELCIWASRQQ